MKNKLKRIEISLIFGLLAAVLIGSIQAGAAAKSAAVLSEKLIRLHVVAASDSKEDQALKLSVRDAVLPLVSSLLKGPVDVEDAKDILEENRSVLQREALRVIAEKGKDYGARILLEPTYFPTKQYDGFALPAGQYYALRIILGEGEGKNWWCVLFPPLCLPAAQQSALETAKEAGLTDGEIALITEEGGYKLKFKTAEIIGELAHRITAWREA